MYQYRYLVCVWLAVCGQYMCAQDQSEQHSIGENSASIESQTPIESNEVRPLVDPSAAESTAGEPASDATSMGAVLPRTPTPEDQPVASLPAEQSSSAQTQSVEPTSPVPSSPVVGDVPQAPTPNIPADMAEKIIEPTGIDTVDVKEPEGNWLFKRIWWEKSKEIYGKIRERVDKIVESRMHFFKERVKLDRDVLDPFYVEIGLDQGALRESVDYLLGLFKKDLDEDGILSASAREKYAALQEEKAAITKLGESVATVQGLDHKLDETLEELMNQINLARSYESEAWQRLDQIAEELSDKKAREHYYAIATLWRNVKEIGNYIQGPFAQHFIQLAQASVQNVKSIKSIADLLQQKGFALKERVELTLKEDEKPSDDEEDEWPVKKPIGWGAWLWDTLTGWF